MVHITKNPPMAGLRCLDPTDDHDTHGLSPKKTFMVGLTKTGATYGVEELMSMGPSPSITVNNISHTIIRTWLTGKK